MRLILALLAAAGVAGLTGCVAYGGGVAYDNGYGPAYGSYGTYGSYTYYDRGPMYHNRDRDHDGVPNRYDAAPDNPRRY